MSTKQLFNRILVPIASKDDARATANAVGQYLQETDSHTILVYVIEKAGGAPDKASVAQREQYAEEIFDVASGILTVQDISHETQILYGTDVAGRIISAADEYDTSSIMFTPRGGSRWLHLLTGDVSHKLVENSDRPVIVLPDVDQNSD